eukprot:TRINITY_DN15682_c0_g1_i1.p1 TRINITY_DN15682_c0_g1~~TRINITY_DN15682_c0_g1_i1.p1  ORF type:complete len:227 (-),score=21.97 TRINITY_DN15682_c0_g1_i1:89-769(-)
MLLFLVLFVSQSTTLDIPDLPFNFSIVPFRGQDWDNNDGALVILGTTGYNSIYTLAPSCPSWSGTITGELSNSQRFLATLFSSDRWGIYFNETVKNDLVYTNHTYSLQDQFGNIVLYGVPQGGGIVLLDKTWKHIGDVTSGSLGRLTVELMNNSNLSSMDRVEISVMAYFEASKFIETQYTSCNAFLYFGLPILIAALCVTFFLCLYAQLLKHRAAKYTQLQDDKW